MRPARAWLFILAGAWLAACASPQAELSPAPSTRIAASSTATIAPTTEPTARLTASATVQPTAEASSTAEMLHLPSGEVLTQLDVGEQELVALTIDDGYGRVPFDAIVDILRERDLQATFFLVAQAAQNLGAERINALIADGHQIAYHSFSHDELDVLRSWSAQDWLADYAAWDAAFRELLGEESYEEAYRPYARAPYGLFNDAFLAACEELELVPFGWSRAPDDLARGIPMQSGDIFLFHVRFPDADLMPDILDESGFEFVTLDELIAAAK